MTPATIKAKQNALQKLMQTLGLEAIVITSFDRYLNEYVPLSDCHRHDVTGFKGSVADVLLPVSGKALLFVDGRYHEQADKECPVDLVEVVKCPYGVSNFNALKSTLQERGIKSLGIEGERMGVGPWRELGQLCQVSLLPSEEIAKIGFGAAPEQGEMVELDQALCGENTMQKLQRICPPRSGVFIAALDSSAWLTNTRGYQLPYQSTSRVQAFACPDKVVLIRDRSAKISSEVRASFDVIDDLSELNVQGLEKIVVFPEQTSVADYMALKQHGLPIEEKSGGITLFHADKNPTEIKVMEDSFERGDRAIFNSLRWLKENAQNNVTEVQWNEQTSKFYSEQGALSQSFKTISGFGANSSIIHYGTPSSSKVYESGELALLDSGGFFAGGLATDTTRTILPHGNASEKQKEVYTLVLKGLLQAQHAIFPEGTHGQAIDALARAPMRRFGYDFAHGTGHGVGINVHEGGYSLTPLSQVPLRPARVGSIEPGIYVPGFGGVRLENIVVVERHPQFKGMLYFRSLVWIGFDHNLIDKKLLNSEELQWLAEYEEQCHKRGRSEAVQS